MKRLFPILLMIVIGFTACSGEGSQYAGKYTGTFTILKDNTTKSGSVRITNNPVSTNGILLYGVLPLEYTSTSVYEASSENVEYITQVLSSMVGSNNFIDSASEQVKNIKVKATFSGNDLNLYVAYEVELLSGLANTEIRIIEFDGSK